MSCSVEVSRKPRVSPLPRQTASKGNAAASTTSCPSSLEAAITDGRKPEHAAEETTRYQTLDGALACLIEDFSLSGIRADPDHPSLFNGHQS